MKPIVTVPGAAGSVLVLDRDALTRMDRRLLAHLAADEPPENALLISRGFIRRAERTRCLCRRMCVEDLKAAPFADRAPAPPAGTPGAASLHDEQGHGYCLRALAGPASMPALRWCRRAREVEQAELQPLSVRETVAALERYEPVVALTRNALAAHEKKATISTATIRAELARLLESPIVLNRALRVAAVEAIEQQGLSMSEIAMRCGRVKHDSSGNASGETSWLARRLGLLPEGGRRTPTPWIHSDVLALIARDGLGLSPREVEAD